MKKNNVDIEFEAIDKINKCVTAKPNHLYFYNDINERSILELTLALKMLANTLKKKAIDDESKVMPIMLHINSFGGFLIDGMSGANAIINCDVDVHTIIDGYCASGATFLSIVGKKRLMYKRSSLLIHQLTGVSAGKYTEHEDNLKNMKREMKMMKDLYKEYTKIPDEKLEEILQRDIWLSAAECLEYKIVDFVI